MKTSITLYSNILKKNRKTGKTPMYLRICSQRKKAKTRLNAGLRTGSFKMGSENYALFGTKLFRKPLIELY